MKVIPEIDEGYSGNASCAINLISTFLFILIFFVVRRLLKKRFINDLSNIVHFWILYKHIVHFAIIWLN
jgi:hypothetical protein